MAALETPNPPQTPDEIGAHAGSKTSRWEIGLGALLVVLVCVLLSEASLWKPAKKLGIKENVQVAEAQAWWDGHLHVPERVWDTALKDGRAYSYFPPMFTIIAAVVVPFADGFPHSLLVMLVAVVPVLAYLLFFRVTGSPLWGAVLAIGYLCGTSAWPVLDRALARGMPYHVNHTLASIGVLVILIDYFGRRRVWPAAIGLVVAALSRQLTGFFVLPVAYMAYRSGAGPVRRRHLAVVGMACLLAASVYGGLNLLKFGRPLTAGYVLIHEGRDDPFARDAREHGLLSTHWVGRNLYYANLGLPELRRVEVGGKRQVRLMPDNSGTGIWWTTPLLLWLLIDARRLVRDRAALLLGAAVVGVYAAQMLWYTTGAFQRGYNRFSLDYLPALLALVASRCVVGWRRWVTLGMIAWSVLYFRYLLGLTHWTVWSW